MGLFSRKNKAPKSGFNMPVIKLETDIHSHILPGIDDGAANINESLDMVKAFIAQGYTKIITTPHIHSLRYWNTKDSIQKAYDILIEAMSKEGLHLDIEFAAEYYLDNKFLELICQDEEILNFSENKYVLIEFSFKSPPIGVDMVYNKLVDKGYQPVIAHPERYEYWVGNLGMFERLRDIGYLFQCNIHSAAGLYGKIPMRIFNDLSGKNWIEFLGSDAHSTHAVSQLGTSIQRSAVQKAILNGVRNHAL